MSKFQWIDKPLNKKQKNDILYYAHNMAKYDTPIEKSEINQIKRLKPGFKIINPNGAVIETGDENDAMRQCFDFIRQSKELIFSTLDDGLIGFGVYQEICYALDNKKKVYLLHNGQLFLINEEIFAKKINIVYNKTKSYKTYAKVIKKQF